MTQQTHRTRDIALLCTVIAALCVVASNFWGQFEETELGCKDYLLAHSSKLKPGPELVFIGIDQPNYADTEIFGAEEIHQTPVLAHLTNTFPWSREVWAEAIERLTAAGAKVVVLDLFFATPAVGDDRLRAALEKHADKVVIGANFSGGNNVRGNALTLGLPAGSLISDDKSWNDTRVGFVTTFPTFDGVVRRARFSVTGELGLPPGETMHSLAARTLEKCGAGKLVPADGALHLFRFSGRPGIGYPPIPLYQIFLPSHWTNNFGGGAFFRDKIVLIGPAAEIFHDAYRTPYRGDAMLGPEIHLNIINAAFRGEFLGETSSEANALVTLAAGGLGLVLAWRMRAPLRRLLVVFLVMAGYALLWFLLFHFCNFFLLAFAPMLALGTGTLAAFTYDFRLLRKERNRIRSTLERYVSRDVVREVLDNPQTYLNTLGGVRKPVTILFSDVRGFTTITESADGAALVAQLNEYFTAMVDVVFAHHGSLDKFIGDSVMALWGSITSHGREQDAQHAVAAALAMRAALARLNASWRERGMMELSFGIGINHGEVIVGNLGSDQKMEVSAIGDAVNLASRLVGVTKQYGLDLLLGESMAPLVQDRFVLRTVESIQVKGKTKRARVLTVVADRKAGETEPPWLKTYEHGLELYRSRDFAAAADAFAECLCTAPGDHLSELYLKRCRELAANPPGPEWDTVLIMDHK